MSVGIIDQFKIIDIKNNQIKITYGKLTGLDLLSQDFKKIPPVVDLRQIIDLRLLLGYPIQNLQFPFVLLELFVANKRLKVLVLIKFCHHHH